MTDLDTALRDLRAIALQHGWSRIEVTVRADGRVELQAICNRGYVAETVEADLDPESAHSLPSIAVTADWIDARLATPSKEHSP